MYTLCIRTLLITKYIKSFFDKSLDPLKIKWFSNLKLFRVSKIWEKFHVFADHRITKVKIKRLKNWKKGFKTPKLRGETSSKQYKIYVSSVSFVVWVCITVTDNNGKFVSFLREYILNTEFNIIKRRKALVYYFG